LIRVGIIGLGKMGQLHLLNALRISEVNVVAAADKRGKNRKTAEKYHVKTYDDYSKLLDAEKLDAVIISLPNFLKKESVFRASERGLNIFLDKPLSRDFAEAQEIVQKAQKEKVALMVGVNYRYFHCVQKLKNVLDDGRVGDVVIVTSDLVLNGPFSHPLVPTPVADWWLSKEMAGGGALLDLGYHLIDILLWMFGDLQVAYSSLEHRLNLPVEDAGTVVLKSKSKGITCAVNVGWFLKSIFPAFNFRINLHGTGGYDSTERYTPRNMRVYAIKEGTLNLLRKLSLRRVHYLSYTYFYSSFYTILESFFEMINQGVASPISLESQLEVMRIIDSIYGEHGAK
jgi:predicted dehydrogenase